MKPLRSAWNRFLGVFSGSRRESDLALEFESHLQMQMDDNRKMGMSPEEARRAAVLKFGGVTQMQERYRDQRGLPLLEIFGKDIRYAFRSMRKNPEFAAAGILSLALGIGATTAIFSAADATLLRSLPYRQPARLATVSLGGAVTAPLYDLFSREARSIEQAALFTNWSFDLSGQGEPQRIPGARVSAGLFSLLGVSPQFGRTFTAEEDRKGNDAVVLIGDRLWKRQFAADPNIVGRTLLLDDKQYTVIGVMPPGFEFPEGPEHHDTVGPFPPAEMWRPMALEDWERTCAGCFNFGMLARLRPGVSAADAGRELTAIVDRRANEGRSKASDAVSVVSLEKAVTRQVRTPILILFGAVTLALLIACVNVANLLLARGLRRREEIAIRLSLGATRRRVIGQGLVEALTLAVCAAVLALPVAWAAIRGLVAIAPPGIARIGSAAVNLRIFGFALVLALVSAAIFGVAPAILAASRPPGDAVKSGARTAAGLPARLRAILVVGEFALSLVLLIGSGLLAQSFLTVSRIPLGFHAENVLTMRSSLPETRYDEPRRAALIQRIVTGCSALPGVTSAAATSALPLTGEGEGWGLVAEDNPNKKDYTAVRARAVTPGYFRTLGIRLRAGRDFNENDRGTPPVAIVSETAARRLWPGIPDPTGRRLASKTPVTIIGVVDDTHASGIDAEIRPYLYVPFWEFSPSDFAIAVRSASNPASLSNAVKAEIWRIDKNQAVTHVAVMTQIVADSLAPRRFQAILMTLFAAFALALAAIGIYGVLSYSVAQRTREIGIRVALGASRSSVIGEVVKQACVLAGAGAALGLIVAFRLTPLLGSLLYGVSITETSIFFGCALVLIGVAIVASLIPAHRAATLHPSTCLRYE